MRITLYHLLRSCAQEDQDKCLRLLLKENVALSKKVFKQRP